VQTDDLQQTAPSIIDISDWSVSRYLNTRGSREKSAAIDNIGTKYFFKESLAKENYQYEFWSEIIAYKLGRMLNLPVLEYVPAVLDDQLGCLCASFLWDNEHLIEGLDIIQSFDPSFDPSFKESRNRYSFQLIERALVQFGQSFRLERLLQTIVFDAVIGNQDRHQENWGFKARAIRKNSIDPKAVIAQAIYLSSKGYARVSWGYSEYKAYQGVSFDIDITDLPIYDNGSSLGRELSPARIEFMLASESNLMNYINRGRAEIRWRDQQLSHFDFIKKLYEEAGYDIWLSQYISQICRLYDENLFQTVLDGIDESLTEGYSDRKLPLERKEFIRRLVTKRIERLGTLL
jgi:hypothetical protein